MRKDLSVRANRAAMSPVAKPAACRRAQCLHVFIMPTTLPTQIKAPLVVMLHGCRVPAAAQRQTVIVN